MYEVFDDVYKGRDKGFGGCCGGNIRMNEGYSIRDKVFYLTLFNKRNEGFFKTIVYAHDEDHAKDIYFKNITYFPKHKDFKIGVEYE